MGIHLTKHDIEAVVSVIDAWPSGTRLTWEAVVGRCETQHGIYSTRQTLSRNSEISLAYKTRKETLREERPCRSSGSFLESQLRTLRAENARLRKENERWSQMFGRWQYNAYKHGLTGQQLDQPMPRANRRRSVSPL